MSSVVNFGVVGAIPVEIPPVGGTTVAIGPTLPRLPLVPWPSLGYGNDGTAASGVSEKFSTFWHFLVRSAELTKGLFDRALASPAGT